MQGIQCLFNLREMQPDEGIKEIMQIVTRGYLTGRVYMRFVREIGRQTVLRYEDKRATACRLEMIRAGDLVRCLQPVAAAYQCLPRFPEWPKPGSLPINDREIHAQYNSNLANEFPVE